MRCLSFGSPFVTDIFHQNWFHFYISQDRSNYHFSVSKNLDVLSSTTSRIYGLIIIDSFVKVWLNSFFFLLSLLTSSIFHVGAVVFQYRTVNACTAEFKPGLFLFAVNNVTFEPWDQLHWWTKSNLADTIKDRNFKIKHENKNDGFHKKVY